MLSAFVLGSVLSIIGTQFAPSPRVFSGLHFGAHPPRVTVTQPTRERQVQDPYVLCGLTIVPIDPSVDPKFTPPLGAEREDVRPAIRRFSTGLCRK